MYQNLGELVCFIESDGGKVYRISSVGNIMVILWRIETKNINLNFK